MKELFKSFFSLCWFALMGSLISCDNCNRDYDFYYDNLLVFYALNKETEQNLLEIGVNRYNSDTFNIYTKNLKPLDIHPDQDGSVVFYFLQPFQRKEEPLDTPIEHTYYVYFEEGDFDTLNIAYQIGLDDCNEKILTQWSAYYNDSLYLNFSSNPPNSKGAFFLK